MSADAGANCRAPGTGTGTGTGTGEEAESGARGNVVTWGLLVALTVGSFLLADAAGSAARVSLLAVAAIKSALVALQFMGLRRAHPLLRFGFLALIAALVLAVWIGAHLP